jgi:hypothetical protein
LNIKIKPVQRSIYIIIFNFVLTLLLRGVFLLELDIGVISLQKYTISFLSLNIDFFNSNVSFILLNITWIITIILFRILSINDYKMPKSIILTELVLLVFAIVLIYRYSPITAPIIVMRLIQGFIFIILYAGIYFALIFYKKRKILRKSKENLTEKSDISEYISKCPFCGTFFQSNPLYCYNCSKQIRED